LEFEAYAKDNPIAAKKMLRQLALLAQVLFDAHALEDKFGLKPSQWPERVDRGLLSNTPITYLNRSLKTSHASG
jgi:hypothetical protein